MKYSGMENDPLEKIIKTKLFIQQLDSLGLILKPPYYKQTRRGLSVSRWRIVHAGHVINKKFHTWASASLWADWNYKSKGSGERRKLWDIIDITA